MRVVSVDVGIVNFAIAVLDENTPVISVLHSDVRSLGQMKDSLSEILDTLRLLLDDAVQTYNPACFVIEHQRLGTKFHRIQTFIEDYCYIHSLPFHIKKAITFRHVTKDCPWRVRKDLSVSLVSHFQTMGVLDSVGTIDHNIADAINLGMTYLKPKLVRNAIKAYQN